MPDWFCLTSLDEDMMGRFAMVGKAEKVNKIVQQKLLKALFFHKPNSFTNSSHKPNFVINDLFEVSEI